MNDAFQGIQIESIELTSIAKTSHSHGNYTRENKKASFTLLLSNEVSRGNKRQTFYTYPFLTSHQSLVGIFISRYAHK